MAMETLGWSRKFSFNSLFSKSGISTNFPPLSLEIRRRIRVPDQQRFGFRKRGILVGLQFRMNEGGCKHATARSEACDLSPCHVSTLAGTRSVSVNPVETSSLLLRSRTVSLRAAALDLQCSCERLAEVDASQPARCHL